METVSKAQNARVIILKALLRGQSVAQIVDNGFYTREVCNHIDFMKKNGVKLPAVIPGYISAEMREKNKRKHINVEELVKISWYATKHEMDIEWVAVQMKTSVSKVKVAIEYLRKKGVDMPYNIKGHQR